MSLKMNVKLLSICGTSDVVKWSWKRRGHERCRGEGGRAKGRRGERALEIMGYGGGHLRLPQTGSRFRPGSVHSFVVQGGTLRCSGVELAAESSLACSFSTYAKDYTFRFSLSTYTQPIDQGLLVSTQLATPVPPKPLKDVSSPQGQLWHHLVFCAFVLLLYPTI
ncbi:hypothetical protein PM082_000498 [Marasmius tenuissimus]|nr:hypothetical protein PM082_000498 [Marasmius tenuissimus]